MRTKLGNPFFSYSSAVAYLLSRLPLAWGHSFREWTHPAPPLSVHAFVACLVYSLSVSVFVLCLDRCLFYDSATWAQAAAKDKAAITGGLFLQPLSHIVISNISSYLSGFGP